MPRTHRRWGTPPQRATLVGGAAATDEPCAAAATRASDRTTTGNRHARRLSGGVAATHRAHGLAAAGSGGYPGPCLVLGIVLIDFSLAWRERVRGGEPPAESRAKGHGDKETRGGVSRRRRHASDTPRSGRGGRPDGPTRTNSSARISNTWRENTEKGGCSPVTCNQRVITSINNQYKRQVPYATTARLCGKQRLGCRRH